MKKCVVLKIEPVAYCKQGGLGHRFGRCADFRYKSLFIGKIKKEATRSPLWHRFSLFEGVRNT